MALGCLFEHLAESQRKDPLRLGARKREAVVEHEARHALDPLQRPNASLLASRALSPAALRAAR